MVNFDYFYLNVETDHPLISLTFPPLEKLERG